MKTLFLLLSMVFTLNAEGNCTKEQAKSNFVDICTVYRNMKDKNGDFDKLKEGCVCVSQKLPVEKFVDPEECAYSFPITEMVLTSNAAKLKCLEKREKQ